MIPNSVVTDQELCQHKANCPALKPPTLKALGWALLSGPARHHPVSQERHKAAMATCSSRDKCYIHITNCMLPGLIF